MKRAAYLALAVTLLAFVAGFWVGNGPKRFAGRLQEAVQADDGAALAALMDAPSVRRSLEQGLHARWEAAKPVQGKAGDGEALAHVLAAAALQPMAEELSRTDGLRWLLHSGLPPEQAWAQLQAQRRGLTASAAVAPSAWGLPRKLEQGWQVDVQGDSTVPALHLHLMKQGLDDWRLGGLSF